jgi:hypothetical protein
LRPGGFAHIAPLSVVAALGLVLGACRRDSPAASTQLDDATAKSLPEAAAERAPAIQSASGAAPLATNDAAITRYADETRIAPARLQATRSNGSARTQASDTDGDVVAALTSGKGVLKVATRGPFVLIVFDDPKDLSRQVMGWVNQSVFVPDVAPKHVPLHCAGGQVLVFVKTGLANVSVTEADDERCELTCRQDSTCPKGTVCIGTGVLSNDGVPGEATKFCQPRAAPLYVPPTAPGSSH